MSGKLREEGDYDAYIRQLIRQVLMTSKGERVCRPEFGGGVRRQVFAPLNVANAALTRTIVFEALTRWLAALIKVERVEVTARQETLSIEVEYLVIARGETRVLNEEVLL